MATPLTPEHRTWRTKIFLSTWLAYIGFYFCRKPFSAAKSAIGEETGWSTTTLGNIWAAYLIAYAVGQFLASQMGPRLGPRRNVMLGMGVSITVTLAMGITLDAWVMAGLVAMNGLAQATGWSGNVGTMASWFHRHERGKVMGVWSTNFTIGALASGFVMGLVLDARPVMLDVTIPYAEITLYDSHSWAWTFFTGAAVLGVIWALFYLFQRNKPEDVGLLPIDDPVTPVDEAIVPDPAPSGFMGLQRDQWINLFVVAGFYFFAKFVRYAVWSWSAFFLKRNYGLTDGEANIWAIVFDVMGLPGVFLTGYISDKYLSSRRGGISFVMMCGMVVSTALLIAFGDSGVAVFAVLLGCVGITLYGPDALLTGAGAMDIGGRRAATFAAAVISGFGSTGAVVQELIIARMYDSKHGDLGPVFELLFGSATMGAVFCGILVLRNRRGGKGI